MQDVEAVNDVAGPEVVDDRPGTEVAVVSTDLDEYKDLIPGLNEMLKLKGIAYDLTIVKGNDRARKDRQMLKRTMTTIEKRCADKKRELKASVAEKIVKLESEADRFVSITDEIYRSVDQQITADETRREDERLARLRAEEERVSAHRARIEAIAAVAVRAVGLSSVEISEKIALVTRMEPGDDFEEFLPHAINTKASTLLSLADLFSNAKAQEEAAERARLDRERLAQLERENAERVQREAVERQQREAAEAEQRRVEAERVADEQRAAAKRTAQSNAANALVEEIRVIQRRGMKSSAAGLLELVSLIEGLAIGDELGDFQGVAQKARDDALADLHDLHETKVAGEAEERRVREAQAAEQRRLDEAAADLRRQQEEVAARERAMAPPPEPEPSGQLTIEAPEGFTVVQSEGADGSLNIGIEADAPLHFTGIDPTTHRTYEIGTLDAITEHGALTDAAGDPGTEDDVDGEGNTPDAHTALPGDMIDVAVLRAFDQAQPIGQMRVLKSALPPDSGFVFSLGFEAQFDGEPGTVPSSRYAGPYKLFAVAPVTDENYIGYLRQIGLLPSADADKAAHNLKVAVVDVMKTATSTSTLKRGRKPGPWVVQHDEMMALKAALRGVRLPGGQFYAEDGTLMNADGTRSIFDDVDA